MDGEHRSMPEVTSERTERPKEYLIYVDGEPVGRVVGKRVREDDEVFWRWEFAPSVPGYKGCWREDYHHPYTSDIQTSWILKSIKKQAEKRAEEER